MDINLKDLSFDDLSITIELIPGHVYMHDTGSLYLGMEGGYLVGLDTGYFDMSSSKYNALPTVAWKDVTDRIQLTEC